MSVREEEVSEGKKKISVHTCHPRGHPWLIEINDVLLYIYIYVTCVCVFVRKFTTVIYTRAPAMRTTLVTKIKFHGACSCQNIEKKK